MICLNIYLQGDICH